jgi:sugar phosphate isomerase/epimerase
VKLGINTYVWSAAYGESVEQVLPKIKEHGFDGIEFTIFRPAEISPARVRRLLGAIGLAGEAALLCDQVGRAKVGILYDTFHANIEEKDIAAGLLTVGNHVKLIHTCENDRGIPGSGHIEWDEAFAAIPKLKYDGWLTIESFGFALGDLSAAAAIWRDVEVTPSAIAFEGVRFLQARTRQ